jgi:hypothetical protein
MANGLYWLGAEPRLSPEKGSTEQITAPDGTAIAKG